MRFSHEHGKKILRIPYWFICLLETEIGHERLRFVPLETLTEVLIVLGRRCKPA